MFALVKKREDQCDNLWIRTKSGRLDLSQVHNLNKCLNKRSKSKQTVCQHRIQYHKITFEVSIGQELTEQNSWKSWIQDHGLLSIIHYRNMRNNRAYATIVSQTSTGKFWDETLSNMSDNCKSLRKTDGLTTQLLQLTFQSVDQIRFSPPINPSLSIPIPIKPGWTTAWRT